MQDQLPALIESDPTPVKAALVPPRMERRWAIAALHRAGLPHRIITAFTQAHPSTVHRWTGRLKEGHAITDRPRCGRPRRRLRSPGSITGPCGTPSGISDGIRRRQVAL
jgi:hypothetical protein